MHDNASRNVRLEAAVLISKLAAVCICSVYVSTLQAAVADHANKIYVQDI